MTEELEAIIYRLVTEQPAFHGTSDRPRVLNATAGTLQMIAKCVRPGQRTSETGSGASTVVFAAAGSRHTTISPDLSEHARIRAWCEAAGVDTVEVEFIEGSSDAVLPGLSEPLDVAFIDGRHAFPSPMVDWAYLSTRLAVGGLLLLDDIPIPTVGFIFRHMAGEPHWELVEVLDARTAVFRKLADPPAEDHWRRQSLNRSYPDYSFLGGGQRVRRTAQYRLKRARTWLARRFPRLRRVARGWRG